jgi:ABC-type spermidine/putrescine transport system permease subunit II
MPSKALAADRATPKAGIGLTAGAWFAVLFLNLPILFIVLYGFTTDEQSYTFPPPGLTTKWFGVTFGRADFWHALWLSVSVAFIAMAAALAGGMLAFALSFDEIIVTTFTAGQQETLPIWMFKELIRPHQRPVTNVAAIIVMVITFGPILLAYYLTRDTQDVAGSGK